MLIHCLSPNPKCNFNSKFSHCHHHCNCSSECICLENNNIDTDNYNQNKIEGKLTYEIDNGSYYYNKISYNGKKGYIKITEENDKYLVKIVYNYSKIETYTDKENLNKIVSIGTIILNNITYNKKIIEKIIDENNGSYSEVTYEIEKPEDASNKFREYLEEYVQEDEEEDKEEDITKQLPDE